jgi:hypothetical protein
MCLLDSLAPGLACQHHWEEASRIGLICCDVDDSASDNSFYISWDPWAIKEVRPVPTIQKSAEKSAKNRQNSLKMFSQMSQ